MLHKCSYCLKNYKCKNKTLDECYEEEDSNICINGENEFGENVWFCCMRCFQDYEDNVDTEEYEEEGEEQSEDESESEEDEEPLKQRERIKKLSIRKNSSDEEESEEE